jgi:hypothetical protein
MLIDYFYDRVAITCKTWADLAMLRLQSLDFGTPAGQFVLENFPTDENSNHTSTTVALTRLNRVRAFKIGWKVLTAETNVVERVLTNQGDFLRNISILNTGESRIRSAPELNRIIKTCCSSGALMALALDEINLAKCIDTFKLITSTCTSLRSLSLRGANLPPKSADHLTSLRSLQSLFWDFGSSLIAEKMKSVPYDMAVIRQLTKLERLGLDGGSGFQSFFPEAMQYLGLLSTDHEVVHKFIEAVRKTLPPLVGIGRLAFHNGGTIFGSLVTSGLPVSFLQIFVDHGAQIESFEVCPGVPTVSPLISNLFHVPFSLPHEKWMVNISARRRSKSNPLKFEIFKWLLESGVELENLVANPNLRLWDPLNKRPVPPPTASTVFTLAAQCRLEDEIMTYASPRDSSNWLGSEI